MFLFCEYLFLLFMFEPLNFISYNTIHERFTLIFIIVASPVQICISAKYLAVVWSHNYQSRLHISYDIMEFTELVCLWRKN